MNETHAQNTKRLAKNTLMLYFRSIFCLVLSLYSSRLILHALGTDDYGINNAVAGFASMFTIVTGALSGAVSRFLTFEQGTGDAKKQKQVFALSLNIMLTLGLVIAILAEVFGTWFVQEKMTIPPGREIAALWAFRLAVLRTMTGLAVVPFNSAIISHEKMGIYAFISVAEAILRVGLAVFLEFGTYDADRLILFVVLTSACTILLQIFAALYSIIKFPECRFRLFFDKKLFKELFSYASWNFFASVSGTLAGQGVNMLINIFDGPATNAARGLAGTVKRSIFMFVNNFTIALVPQITKAYAGGDMNYVKYLTYRGSRFSFFIMFLISLPVLLEAEFVFTLWLGEGAVPEHTIAFNRLSLIVCLTDLLSTLYGAVQNASGNIRTLKLALSFNTLLQFPIAWVLLKNGFPPEYVYVVAIGTSLLCLAASIKIVRPVLKFTNREIWQEMYYPELKVVLASVILPSLSVYFLPYGWMRFLITGTLCVLTTVPAILYLGCLPKEREYIIQNVKNFSSRLLSRS